MGKMCIRDSVKAYQEAYNATPDQFAADGYDAVYAVKAAIEAAKGSKLSSGMTALHSIKGSPK